MTLPAMTPPHPSHRALARDLFRDPSALADVLDDHASTIRAATFTLHADDAPLEGPDAMAVARLHLSATNLAALADALRDRRRGTN